MSLVPMLRRAGAVALITAAVTGVAGCSHVPVKAAWQLRNFDPMTTDLARLRAAVAMPGEALPARGGAKLVMTQGRKGGADTETVEVALEEVSLAAETGLASVRPGKGQVVRAFRVPPGEIAGLTAARERAAARAAAEPGAFTGTLSVGIDGCRRADAPLPKEFRVSTWLKTAETAEYVRLIDDLDLVALVGAEKLAAEAKICEAGEAAPSGVTAPRDGR